MKRCLICGAREGVLSLVQCRCSAWTCSPYASDCQQVHEQRRHGLVNEPPIVGEHEHELLPTDAWQLFSGGSAPIDAAICTQCHQGLAVLMSGRVGLARVEGRELVVSFPT